MDKVIFFFHRKDGLTRAEFFEHYLEVHAKLGMRLTRTMDGYTVSLTDVVDDATAPDAVTEIWTASSADFMDAEKSFATPDDARELMTDHDSFIGPYDAYLVEERVVRADDGGTPLGERSPGVKRVSLHAPGEASPVAGDGVVEIVEDRVVQALTPGAPPVGLVVSMRAASVADLGAAPAVAYYTSEYRQQRAG